MTGIKKASEYVVPEELHVRLNADRSGAEGGVRSPNAGRRKFYVFNVSGAKQQRRGHCGRGSVSQ